MKLSIITINYNNKSGLQKTIDSVICQTFRDYEWIVIDGGSTDGSKELIEEYQDHFAYWCSEPDKGVYNAMNKGIAHAKGEYLNFMNSGDCFSSPEVIESVFCLNNCEDIVYGNVLQTYKDHQVLITQYQQDYRYPIFILKDNLCHQSMFIRRKLLKERGYEESFTLLADWARNIEFFFSGATFKYVPVTICNYDAYGISSSNAIVKKLESDMIRSRCLPWQLYVWEEIYSYKGDTYIQKMTAILKTNNFYSIILKIVIKVLYMCILKKQVSS